MEPAQFWIFVSAVSDEYGPARSEVARRLRQEGFRVREQADFRYEHQSESLLSKLHDYIRDCDGVVAIVGMQGGSSPGEADAADWAHLLPEGLTSPSYAHWELIFARLYGKRVLLFGLADAFTAAPEGMDSSMPDQQRRFLRWLDEIGLQREEFHASGHVVHLVMARVQEQEWRALALAQPSLPEPVSDYLSRLQRSTLRRIGQTVGRHVSSLGQARRYLAERAVIDPRHPTETIILPQNVLHNAEWQLHPGYEFDEMLILGGAGAGKSTLAMSLLAELGNPRNSRRWRLVPLLADCVPLSRMLTKDRAADDAIIDKWLSAAIEVRDVAADPAQSPVMSENAAAFLTAVNEAGCRLVIVIDGLDELEPGDPRDDTGELRIVRLFRAMQRWEAARGIRPCLRLATSRPSFGNIESVTGMRSVMLQPPSEREVRRLARTMGITAAMLDRFTQMFCDPSEIDSQLVFLRPLISYFAGRRDKVAAGTVSRVQLIQLEIDHSIDEILHQLRRTTISAGGDGAMRRRLRNLLVLLALSLVDPQDLERSAQLNRDEVRALTVKAGLIEAIDTTLESDRLVSKILDILIESGGLRDASAAEPHYRLAHNEYRDYLIADGLVRSITAAMSPDSSHASTLAGLARAHHRSARVQAFVAESGVFDDPEFATQLILLANDHERVIDHDTGERAGCSTRGALLTLLLSLPTLPAIPILETVGGNFHGARIPTGRSVRVRLPGTGDWRRSCLRDADLRGADLSGFDLSDADLDNALLNGADLSGARLTRASLRNVAMGRHRGWPTSLTQAVLNDDEDEGFGPDWFNARFQGLYGFFCFWDIESVLDGRCLLVAGSRGQLVLMGFDDKAWQPIYLATRHEDDILDVTAHPTENIIATTGRDNTVRLHELPPGSPDTWPVTELGGKAVSFLPELTVLRDVFPDEYYTRRSVFGRSGQWLAIIGRDPRVAFVRLPRGSFRTSGLAVTAYGYAHAGPVMCVEAASGHEIHSAPGIRPSDRFYTAGYDGRLVLWREDRRAARPEHSWLEPVISTTPAMTESGHPDTARAMLVLRAPSQLADHILLGTELESRIHAYEEAVGDLVPKGSGGAELPGSNGVFALARHAGRSLCAVGFASGEVRVVRAGLNGGYDWEHPWCRCRAGDDIVRAVQFLPNGTGLVAATWDGTLSLFAIPEDQTAETLQPQRRFEYPESWWLPEADANKIQFDDTVDLRRSRGISGRMKRYLSRVGQARTGGGHGGRDTASEHLR